jgi:hypothetical protein
MKQVGKVIVITNKEGDVKLNLDFLLQQTLVCLKQYQLPIPLSFNRFGCELVNTI